VRVGPVGLVSVSGCGPWPVLYFNSTLADERNDEEQNRNWVHPYAWLSSTRRSDLGELVGRLAQ
jgi:hypothetical protein